MLWTRTIAPHDGLFPMSKNKISVQWNWIFVKQTGFLAIKQISFTYT